MSSIVDFAETVSQGASLLSGFDVVGLDTESIVGESADYESMVREGFGDIREDNYSYNFNHSYNFSEGEGEYSYSFDAGGEGVSQDADSEVSESVDSEAVAENSGEDSLVVEFFNDGIEAFSDLVEGEDNIVIKGIGENAEVEYDKQSGTLSIDGKELVQLDFSFDSHDDNYEIF